MTLPLIKILLLGSVAVFAVLAYRGSKRASYRLMWRAYGAAVVGGAVVTVLFPNSLTRVAKVVGVGRGTDLLLYVLVVSFMLTSVVLVRRVGELERRYVSLARSIALRNPLDPDLRRSGDDSV